MFMQRHARGDRPHLPRIGPGAPAAASGPARP